MSIIKEIKAFRSKNKRMVSTTHELQYEDFIKVAPKLPKHFPTFNLDVIKGQPVKLTIYSF